ncbi:DUF792 family protein [Candidatus Borreliella tachyglossi]|uniref:DUF792 family protein n=1 Tax=Candidatus Borreliella tachyglossi TaxID=1964448 RepID=UPI004041708E
MKILKDIANPDKIFKTMKQPIVEWGIDATTNPEEAGRLRAERSAVFKGIEENSKLIMEISNQVLTLLGGGSWIALYPRLDFYGLGFIPQLFFITPVYEYIEVSTGQEGSTYPIINPVTRNLQNASYNIYGKPYTITLNNGNLTSFYEKLIFKEALKRLPLFNKIFRETKSLVKKQLEERVKAGVPFSFYSPTVGYINYTKIPRLVTRPTEFEDTYSISITVEEIEVGYLEDFNFK